MIGSIKHRGLRVLYEQDNARFIDAGMRARVIKILTILDAADSIEKVDIPGYRLHKLTGSLQDYWSLRVTGNWRIIFRFEDGVAYDVDLIDYH